MEGLQEGLRARRTARLSTEPDRLAYPRPREQRLGARRAPGCGGRLPSADHERFRALGIRAAGRSYSPARPSSPMPARSRSLEDTYGFKLTLGPAHRARGRGNHGHDHRRCRAHGRHQHGDGLCHRRRNRRGEPRRPRGRQARSADLRSGAPHPGSRAARLSRHRETRQASHGEPRSPDAAAAQRARAGRWRSRSSRSPESICGRRVCCSEHPRFPAAPAGFRARTLQRLPASIGWARC